MCKSARNLSHAVVLSEHHCVRIVKFRFLEVPCALDTSKNRLLGFFNLNGIDIHLSTVRSTSTVSQFNLFRQSCFCCQHLLLLGQFFKLYNCHRPGVCALDNQLQGDIIVHNQPTMPISMPHLSSKGSPPEIVSRFKGALPE